LLLFILLRSKRNIIKFIRYRWSLTKTIEFLRSKKFDVNIPKYFLNQLSIFESYLLKIGQGPKSNTWEGKQLNINHINLLLLISINLTLL